jgi:hypothetical protein
MGTLHDLLYEAGFRLDEAAEEPIRQLVAITPLQVPLQVAT